MNYVDSSSGNARVYADKLSDELSFLPTFVEIDDPSPDKLGHYYNVTLVTIMNVITIRSLHPRPTFPHTSLVLQQERAEVVTFNHESNRLRNNRSLPNVGQRSR